MNNKSSYSEFETSLLKYVYLHGVELGHGVFSPFEVMEKYGLSAEQEWVAQATSRMTQLGFIKGPVSQDLVWMLTGGGLRGAERIIDHNRKRTFREKISSISRSDWIAIGALIVSVIALIRGA